MADRVETSAGEGQPRFPGCVHFRWRGDLHQKFQGCRTKEGGNICTHTDTCAVCHSWSPRDWEALDAAIALSVRRRTNRSQSKEGTMTHQEDVLTLEPNEDTDFDDNKKTQVREKGEVWVTTFQISAGERWVTLIVGRATGRQGRSLLLWLVIPRSTLRTWMEIGWRRPVLLWRDQSSPTRSVWMPGTLPRGWCQAPVYGVWCQAPVCGVWCRALWQKVWCRAPRGLRLSEVQCPASGWTGDGIGSIWFCSDGRNGAYGPFSPCSWIPNGAFDVWTTGRVTRRCHGQAWSASSLSRPFRADRIQHSPAGYGDSGWSDSWGVCGDGLSSEETRSHQRNQGWDISPGGRAACRWHAGHGLDQYVPPACTCFVPRNAGVDAIICGPVWTGSFSVVYDAWDSLNFDIIITVGQVIHEYADADATHDDEDDAEDGNTVTSDDASPSFLASCHDGDVSAGITGFSISADLEQVPVPASVQSTLAASSSLDQQTVPPTRPA